MSIINASAGVLIGSTLGGSMATGVPAVDVLKSLQGGVGAALGFAAGSLVTDAHYAPFIGMLLIPLVSGGVVDKGLAGVLVGGYLGQYFATIQKKDDLGGSSK